MDEVASTAGEIMAAASVEVDFMNEAKFVADGVVAEATCTADEFAPEAASAADEVVAEAASTGGRCRGRGCVHGRPEAASTADEVVTETAPILRRTRSKIVFFQCSHRFSAVLREESVYPLPTQR